MLDTYQGAWTLCSINACILLLLGCTIYILVNSYINYYILFIYKYKEIGLLLLFLVVYILYGHIIQIFSIISYMSIINKQDYYYYHYY